MPADRLGRILKREALIGAQPSSDKLSFAAVGQSGPALQPLDFVDLPGFAEDDLGEAFATFRRSAAALADRSTPLRVGLPPNAALIAAAEAATRLADVSAAAARAFFTAHFRPHRIGSGLAFFTGYFEPVVDGALTQSAEFTAPILSRPADLVTLPANNPLASPDGPLQSALRAPDGSLTPCPDRAAIEAGVLAGRANPIVWLRDPVQVFIIHVQGSARVRLPDGRMLRLSYAGRNGWPYTSIGRILVEQTHIPAAEMSLARLKDWIRENGQEVGQAGRALMQRNRSYIFFQAQEIAGDVAGPTGAQGVSLTPWRSVAVDRSLWSYGLPFWIDAELPWHQPTPTPFRRLMIAQDTGSAIVGAKRADIYVGSGEEAGRIAGGFRHHGEMIVLLPADVPP
ncbi:MAG: rane-bound lytic murein transglycosylase [Methylobacteriaceae bacterium]|nr:rane-bound lytic murein transglycosylase [Methylobacteriaceae bacterium]